MTSEPPPSPSTPPVLRASDWQVGVWRMFLRAHATVLRDLERDLGDTELPLGWYDVLLQLLEAPSKRLRMAELADRVLLSRSGLTRMIDRMQAAGYVRREPSPDDARGMFTVLTREGFGALREAAPRHLAGVREHWLAFYTDDELRVLENLLSRVVPPVQM